MSTKNNVSLTLLVILLMTLFGGSTQKVLAAEEAPVDCGSIKTGTAQTCFVTVAAPSNIDATTPAKLVSELNPIASGFAITKDDCSAGVTLGHSCGITVTFTPKEPGAVKAELVISRQESTGVIDIYKTYELKGVGTHPAPSIWIIIGCCLLYWLGMVTERWHRIARPTRELLIAQLNSLRRELANLPDAAGKQAANIACLFTAAETLLGVARDPGANDKMERSCARPGTVLFWSRGEETTGWGYVHEAEVQMATLLDDATVTARLLRLH